METNEIIMKQCSKCKELKDENDYSWKNKSLNKRAVECKVCHRKQRKHYYDNNKQREIERTTERKNMLREWFFNYKSTLECNRCGENHIATLQFHHTDPSEKKFNLSNGYSLGLSKEKIVKEIEKCEVLCANCHSILHWKERI